MTWLKIRILLWLGFDTARVNMLTQENVRLARAVKEIQDTVLSMASEVNNLHTFVYQHYEIADAPAAPTQRVRKATTWREFASAAAQANRGASK